MPKSINIEDFLKLDFNIFELFETTDKNWNMYDLLESRKKDKNSKLYWVDDIFLIAIYNNTSWEVDPSLMAWYEWANKEFIDDFIRFKKELSWFIWDKCFLWKQERKSDFVDYFANYNFTQRDILQFYILTNWKLEIEWFNDLELWLIYFKVFQMLGMDDLRWETYTYAIIQWVFWESREFVDKVPDSFKKTILDYIKKAWEEFIESTTGFIKEVWWSLTEEQQNKLTWLWIWALIIAILMVKTWLYAIVKVSSMLIWWSIALIWINQLYDFLSSSENSETKNVLKKYKITNKEEFAEKFQDSIS